MAADGSGAGRLHFEVVGSGPPLFLIPGLGGLAGFWSRQVPLLSRHFTVISHDHRGIGRSQPGPAAGSIAEMAADVLGLADRVGVERFDLLGHSMGGAVAQHIAAHHPGRIGRLVLSATWARADAYMHRTFRLRQSILSLQGPAAYVAASTLLLYPPRWIAARDAELAAQEAAGLHGFPPVDAVLARIDALLAFDGAAIAHRIGAPTLVLCAADDALTPPYLSEALAEEVRGAALRILPGGGHYCPVTEAEAYADAVLAFLDRTPRAAAGARVDAVPAQRI